MILGALAARLNCGANQFPESLRGADVADLQPLFLAPIAGLVPALLVATPVLLNNVSAQQVPASSSTMDVNYLAA